MTLTTTASLTFRFKSKLVKDLKTHNQKMKSRGIFKNAAERGNAVPLTKQDYERKVNAINGSHEHRKQNH